MLGDIYRSRIARMLYFIIRIQTILTKPCHECTQFFNIEINLWDTNPLQPILPWSIINGKIPKDYSIKMEVRNDEYPMADYQIFSYFTGPVIGDITWIKGRFISDSILLASVTQRPILPLIFTNVRGIIRGKQILQNEPSWIYFTHLLKFIYGPITTLFIGDWITPGGSYILYDTLDPQFKPNKSM
jgi:hypothetical protein